MITRWFLTNKQKSKGFWNGCYNDNTQKPQFTKQTALAKVFKNETDAKDFLDKLITNNKTFVENGKAIIKYVKANKIDKQHRWEVMPFQTKIKHINKICELNNMKDLNDNGSYYGRSNLLDNKKIVKYYIRSIPCFNWCNNDEEKNKEASNDWNWNVDIEYIEREMNKSINLIEFLKKEMYVNEAELVFKFNNQNKRKLHWTTTGDTAVNEDFCSACGCSAPNMPQLSIGGGYCGYKISVCCLAKIVPTIERELEKADQDVIEHYETQTFLEAL